MASMLVSNKTTAGFSVVDVELG